jgi:hypothetical protein
MAWPSRRESLADAGVHAIADGELADVVASDVEFVGGFPVTLVAVGGGVGDHQARPSRYGRAVDLGVALDRAPEVAIGLSSTCVS